MYSRISGLLLSLALTLNAYAQAPSAPASAAAAGPGPTAYFIKFKVRPGKNADFGSADVRDHRAIRGCRGEQGTRRERLHAEGPSRPERLAGWRPEPQNLVFIRSK